MKFYKVFDYNSQYVAFWGSDLLNVIDDWKSYADSYADEYDVGCTAELRSFDTWDIAPQKYHEIDKVDYFSSLSRLEKIYTLTQCGEYCYKWVEN